MYYSAPGGGTLNGSLMEWVQYGEKPTAVPTPQDTKQYTFLYWQDAAGNQVDPIEIPVTEDTHFYAVFEEIPVQYHDITLYSRSYSLTSSSATATNPNENSNIVAVEDGQKIPSNFDISSGYIFNSEGDFLDNFNEIATHEDWYQRIAVSTVAAASGYARKTFVAGVGGHLTYNNSLIYARTSRVTVSSWGGTSSITPPTPVAEDGWEFSHWYNVTDEEVDSSPASGHLTSGDATVYVAIFKKS